MNTEHWWIDNNGVRTPARGEKKDPSQCHFVHHKSHKDWLGIEPRQANNCME